MLKADAGGSHFGCGGHAAAIELFNQALTDAWPPSDERQKTIGLPGTMPVVHRAGLELIEKVIGDAAGRLELSLGGVEVFGRAYREESAGQMDLDVPNPDARYALAAAAGSSASDTVIRIAGSSTAAIRIDAGAFNG